MFANYAFYTANGGRLPEARYKMFVDRAFNAIIQQTNGAAKTAPKSMKIPLKLCECDLVDIFAGYASTAKYLPGNIKSASNDGFSVSIGAGSSADSLANDVFVTCAHYLTTPENLMLRWL